MTKTALLARAYLHPFRNKKLVFVYAATFLGTLSNSFLTFYLAIDMIQLGWKGMAAYSLAWFVPAGFVLFPLFYLLFVRFLRRGLVMGVLGTQCVGLLLFLTTPLNTTPWGLGLLTALSVTGYWQMYHGNMAAHTQGGEVGFEASLARATSSLAKLGGASLAGVLVGHGGKMPLLLTAFAGVFLATSLFGKVFPKSKKNERAENEISASSFRKVLVGDLPMTLGTVLEALWELFSASMVSVVLVVMGVNVAVAGLSQGMQGMAQLLLVPVLGRYIHEGKGREFTAASALGIGSLGLFCLSLGALPVVAGRMMGALSSFCYSGGLESRWYMKRCMTQILVREMNLTLTRMVSIPPACWLGFTHPHIFLAVGIGVAALMIPVGRRAVAAVHA